MPDIVARSLSKSYGELKAVDAVDLEVGEGEIFGLLGPNGAGKTTLLSMLSTLLQPTSGRASVAGFDVVDQAPHVRTRIGVVFQDPSLDEELTGRENLLFHARLYKVPRADRAARIDELLRVVELEDRQHDIVKTYSGGMRRRLELARGLLHRPRVLFLDEPTLGLDPQTRIRIWEYVRRLNREERITMLLTTHYMEEADRFCDRIAIIDRGRIVALDTPARLKAAIGDDVIHLSINGHGPDLAPVLRHVRNVSDVTRLDDGLQIETRDGESTIPLLLEAARGAGGSVQSIRLQKPTLDDVFLKHTGRHIRDESMDARDRMSYYMRGRKH